LRTTALLVGGRGDKISAAKGVRAMNVNVNPTSEHALYLKLFITNGGGW
jgi:hypothetical protein